MHCSFRNNSGQETGQIFRYYICRVGGRTDDRASPRPRRLSRKTNRAATRGNRIRALRRLPRGRAGAPRERNVRVAFAANRPGPDRLRLFEFDRIGCRVIFQRMSGTPANPGRKRGGSAASGRKKERVRFDVSIPKRDSALRRLSPTAIPCASRSAVTHRSHRIARTVRNALFGS